MILRYTDEADPDGQWTLDVDHEGTSPFEAIQMCQHAAELLEERQIYADDDGAVEFDDEDQDLEP